MSITQRLFGAILVVALAALSSAAFAECPVKGPIQAEVTPDNLMLQGAVKGQTVDHHVFARNLFNFFRKEGCAVKEDGSLRQSWGSVQEFGNMFVDFHGTSSNWDAFAAKAKAPGYMLPGFGPNPNRQQAVTTPASVRKPLPCPWCRKGAEGMGEIVNVTAAPAAGNK